jgi:two-component sensor histidine kinase
MQDNRLVVAAFDALECEIAVLDEAGKILRVNEAWRRAARANGCTDPRAYEQQNYLDVCRRAEQAGDSGAAIARSGIEAVVRKDCERYVQHYLCRMPSGDHWFRMTVTPTHDGAVVAHDDVTPLVEAERRQKLLTNELNHRVKNTLAIVQAIASQSIRSSADVQAVKQAFVARIGALARVHDTLTATAWSGAALAEIADATLEPFRSSGGTVTATGPDVRLDAGTAVTLSLALHELATNATKHGALSQPTGHVTLEWAVPESGTEVNLSWIESGGPVVMPPTHEGFGSRLIRSMARGGDFEVAFDPAGVRYRLSLPIEQS